MYASLRQQSSAVGALPSIKQDAWVTLVQATDALLIFGGNPFYQCFWMCRSGLADLLPSLRPERIYVGVSAGSMVVTTDYSGPTNLDSNPAQNKIDCSP